MEGERAANLRRKIELYRRWLRDGVDAGLAIDYLREIAEAEAELAEIDRRGAERRC
jgi:hypothetical protein